MGDENTTEKTLVVLPESYQSRRRLSLIVISTRYLLRVQRWRSSAREITIISLQLVVADGSIALPIYRIPRDCP